MKFFIDTANLAQIREAQALGILDGVTTNPSLMAKEGITGEANIINHYKEICELVEGDVSAEVIATDFDGMVKEGEALAALNPQIVVKLPMIKDGIKACKYFSSKGIDLLENLKEINIIRQLKEIPTMLNIILEGLGDFSAGLFSVLFILFFFMKDSRLLKNGIITIIPKNTESRFSDSLEKINNLLSRYFIGLIIQISILLIFYTIILLSFGISNALVIAFLCSLINLIPYIGPLIGGFIIFILSMTSNIGQDFQTQIEGTENRIGVARKDYNKAVEDYNLTVKVFPKNILANIFGYKEKGYYQAAAGSENAPDIKFDIK